MRLPLHFFFCTALLFISLAEITNAQTILRVNSSNTNPSKAADGSSWQKSFTDLQSALLTAASDISKGENVQVWIALGSYYPSSPNNVHDRNATFNIPSGVSLYGGFHSGDEDFTKRNVDTALTVLSGDIGKTQDNNDNCFSVITTLDLKSATIIDGFTITGGNAMGSSHGEGDGGGIYNRNGENHLTISNCTFTNNSAEQGAALYNLVLNGDCTPTITHCKFINNSATAGTVYNLAAQSSTNCSPLFSNCIFASNTNSEKGAVVNHCEGNNACNPAFVNCIFYMNMLTTKTGNGSEKGSAVVNEGGGVVCDVSPVFVNCTFNGNVASVNAGTIYNSLATPTIINCIVWGNKSGGILSGDKDKLSITYSDIQGWIGNSKNNDTDTDPIFKDVTNARGNDGIWGTDDDGLIPDCNSPLKARATNYAGIVGARIPTDDMEDNTRSSDVMDMGAYMAMNIIDPVLKLNDGNAAITFCKGDQVTIKTFTNTPGGIYTWYRTKRKSKPVADNVQHGDTYTANDFDDAEIVTCKLAIDPATCTSIKIVSSAPITMEQKICASMATGKPNYGPMILFSIPLLVLMFILIRGSFGSTAKREKILSSNSDVS